MLHNKGNVIMPQISCFKINILLKLCNFTLQTMKNLDLSQ
jgi:hypothetical protein